MGATLKRLRAGGGPFFSPTSAFGRDRSGGFIPVCLVLLVTVWVLASRASLKWWSDPVIGHCAHVQLPHPGFYGNECFKDLPQCLQTAADLCSSQGFSCGKACLVVTAHHLIQMRCGLEGGSASCREAMHRKLAPVVRRAYPSIDIDQLGQHVKNWRRSDGTHSFLHWSKGLRSWGPLKRGEHEHVGRVEGPFGLSEGRMHQVVDDPGVAEEEGFGEDDFRRVHRSGAQGGGGQGGRGGGVAEVTFEQARPAQREDDGVQDWDKLDAIDYSALDDDYEFD
ncbi:unnamed protein product [Pedinophyceae sp. YPF-701]|nr:unnamed protein product [Pedinophyceae sp. YPF-701]